MMCSTGGYKYVKFLQQALNCFLVFLCALFDPGSHCMQILKLEANLLRAEQQRSLESEAVFQCRAEAASKVKHLRATIQVSNHVHYGPIILCGGLVA